MSKRPKRVSISTLRQRYRPNRIRLLFVGESPPANGRFFYAANSNLYRYTAEAFERVFKADRRERDLFLRRFQRLGCYLVDLCNTPANQLSQAARAELRRAGVGRLRRLMKQYEPDAVVCVMQGIVPFVREALRGTRLRDGSLLQLPFPAFGHSSGYTVGLAAVIRQLARSGVLRREAWR
jgi:hypothetical protein